LTYSFWNQQEAKNRPIDVFPLDFSRIEDVKNIYTNWIETKTSKSIKNVNTDINASTNIFLANTVYYKGQWLFPFGAVDKNDFYLSSGNKIQVDSMSVVAKFLCGSFPYVSARWCVIPYNSSESMIIILPNDGECIENIVNSLILKDFMDIIRSMNNIPAEQILNVTLPKFAISSSINLQNSLIKVNIEI